MTFIDPSLIIAALQPIMVTPVSTITDQPKDKRVGAVHLADRDDRTVDGHCKTRGWPSPTRHTARSNVFRLTGITTS